MPHVHVCLCADEVYVLRTFFSVALGYYTIQTKKNRTDDPMSHRSVPFLIHLLECETQVQSVKGQIPFNNQSFLVYCVDVRASLNDQNATLPMSMTNFLAAQLEMMNLFSVFFFAPVFLAAVLLMPSIKLYFTLKNKMYSGKNAFAVVSTVFLCDRQDAMACFSMHISTVRMATNVYNIFLHSVAISRHCFQSRMFDQLLGMARMTI